MSAGEGKWDQKMGGRIVSVNSIFFLAAAISQEMSGEVAFTLAAPLLEDVVQ